MTGDSGLAVYIDPPSWHFLDDRLFDPSTNPLSGDDILRPYLALRESFEARGIPLHTADRFDGRETGVVNVYFSIGRTAELRRFRDRDDTVVSTYFAMECPIVDPKLFRNIPRISADFRHLLSWSDGVALEPFIGERLLFERFLWPQAFDRVHDGIWDNRDRGFLVMINANKLPADRRKELYTERVKAVAYFHRFGEIDLYGPNWDKAPRDMSRAFLPGTVQKGLLHAWELKQRIRPNRDYAACAEASRGTTPSKARTLGSYRFALCFENMVLRGWITEKIFDCFFAGAVPIYWGAPDIQEFIPKECFIDFRDFMDFGTLREYLHELTEDEVEEYRLAAKRFLASPAFDPFRLSTWVERFHRLVREDTGEGDPES